MTKSSHLKSFLDSERGSIIISIIVGLGLATLFKRACKGHGCYVIRGPPVSDLNKHVYKQDGRCYKYTPEATKCRD